MNQAGHVLRVYADTSVFGGCFDEEFAEESRQFFEQVRIGGFLLVLSDTTLRELRDAPGQVRHLLFTLPPESLERIGTSEEIETLTWLQKLSDLPPNVMQNISHRRRWPAWI